MSRLKLAYVILAAGGASRFGGCKQLAQIDFGKTLLERAIELSLFVATDEVHLVLGAYREQIISKLQLGQEQTYRSRVKIIVNEDWQLGIASSITAALNQLGDDSDGVCFLLADQVAIHSMQLRDLQLIWEQNPDKIVAAQYLDITGVPAIFPRKYFGDLQQLQGDTGAKSVLQKNRNNVIPFELEDARWDIDTERELSDWLVDSL
ncbi:MAG: 4-diphosphocytidyl-2C-methyl-D-erythritol kinase [Alteromonadaceae bacterium]|nr:MAG: 4-diphosphocytidyl-2C-methyl-D-erythritol kinase [Alteromonadaceae bacterium]